MTLSSIGDRAQSFALRNQTTRLKAELNSRSTEATTGRTRDIGQTVRGDFTPLSAIDASLARLKEFRDVTSETSLTASAMQSTLATLSGLSSELASTLLSVASAGNPISVDAVGSDAMARFRTAVGTLNARVGDRTLFAGTETRQSALASAEDIMNAVVIAAAGATTASDVEAALNTWFADPAGYAMLAYRGGPSLDPQMVATDEQVTLDATANDPAVRDTLKGLAMAALLDRGVLSGNLDQRARLARRAGEVLVEGTAGRSALAARIGTAEGRIAAAETRNSAESTALNIARTGIVSIDPFEAATALTDAKTQIDTLYAITARLSRLSLANYL